MLRTEATIINIDETWIDYVDFRRRSWKLPGQSNSIAVKQVMPRLSLIVAVSSNGDVYASMLQSNMDSGNFSMFVRHLSNILDQGASNWREKTIITMDGAPYHMSSESMAIYKSLDLPIMFNPPHAYNVSPAELVFAAVKSKNLNLGGLKTSKSNFHNVMVIIFERLKAIPRHTYVLYFHHCLQHTLRYLQFMRL